MVHLSVRPNLSFTADDKTRACVLPMPEKSAAEARASRRMPILNGYPTRFAWQLPPFIHLQSSNNARNNFLFTLCNKKYACGVHLFFERVSFGPDTTNTG